MPKKISKTEAISNIEKFFSVVRTKMPKEVKKIKTLAMAFNIPLKEKRKTFCKKCLSPYANPKIRIKNIVKSITCEKCCFVSRWKIKIS